MIKSVERFNYCSAVLIVLFFSCNLQEGVLNLFKQSLIKSKHVMLQGNALAESGAQIAYQAFFNDFCLSVFRSTYCDNEDVWKMTLYIIKEVVDLDPAYLATFLASSACTELSDLLSDSSKNWFGMSSAGAIARFGSILVPICKLAQAICITAEGRTLVGKSKMLQFVLEAVTGDLNLAIPMSFGSIGLVKESFALSADKLHKIGKAMSQVLLDCEAVRVPIKTLLREKMLSLCREASTNYKSVFGGVPPPTNPTNASSEHPQKKFTTPQAWHSSSDHSAIRGAMAEEILKLLRSRRPNASAELLEKLSHTAKRLEDGLFHEANTLTEYNDLITLRTRLQQLAASIASLYLSGPVLKSSVDAAVTQPQESSHPGDSCRHLQVLQRLTNLCALIEGMFVENKTRHNNELMRDLLNDQVVEALMQTYAYTLPQSDQMFAQLSIRDAMVLGFGSGAKSITALLKFSAHNAPQNIVPIVCRQLEWALSNIGVTRQALDLEVKSKNVGEEETAIGSFKNIEKMMEKDPILLLRKRGSSLGRSPSPPPPSTSTAAVSTSSVFVLGLLDNIPDRSILDPALRRELSRNSNELQVHLTRFLTSILTLEWLSILLTTALRSMKVQSGAGISAILANRDLLRRLLAFHRSSVLEVCRLTSKTIPDKVTR